MAEYIERQKVITKISRWLLDRETKGNYAVLRNMLDDIPTADVVERSKIDKAIEEIDFLRQHRTKYITEDNRICIDSGEVLQILKRNIEE